MTVSDRYKFLTSCFIYKCLNDHNVQYNMENTFISKFKYANESHQHNTRFANNDCLTIPVTKTTCFKAVYHIMVYLFGTIYLLTLETVITCLILRISLNLIL